MSFRPKKRLFLVYFISGVAETNRAPFDVAEGESEIVAGFHVEYSGVVFVLFFLAEYANIILIAALTSIFFFGGYASFFEGWTFLEGSVLSWLMAPAFGWLALKICFFIFVLSNIVVSIASTIEKALSIAKVSNVKKNNKLKNVAKGIKLNA